jgi:VanZ family protein
MQKYIRKYGFSIAIIALIWYLSLFKPPRIEIASEIPLFDKWVHTLMYGGFCCVLWWEYLRSHKSLNGRKLLLWAIAAPIAMSGAIELIQQYCTTYRGGDWFDLLANSIGVLLGATIGCFVLRKVVRHRR